MATRIYLDANIYLDYLEKRSNGIRPLQEFAFRVFRRAVGCEFEIVVSDWVLEELKAQKYNKETLNILIDNLKNCRKLVWVERKREDELKAKSKTKNWKDALHAILAKKAGCEKIVTRNITDFLEFVDLVEPVLPENL